ncbi:TonB-dependent receptor plug domain-containing protein [Aquisalinus flavus]|uniref:TonB-dependent receptor n=1 Tax=Aquisalinus flavus TaxID=1526572 RepID=A0A8J2V3B9_9PROT|nr:TonB-dependent receptor [Aquisalinus flavus]MBD0426066.1 TonB-dependent receptor [Aquisalinus flavus]UNE48349.1 TonB-dependent receptor [Aquisalinus flavus]GGD10963.1 TonB-dependent receptor [Aquisalinus flavus]
MKRLLLLASTASLLSTLPAIALPACAQDDAGKDEIIVEGTRLDQRVTENGSSVAIITEEILSQYTFVVDALATAPGVTVNQNGGYGGAASVRIRGAGSEQTLVLIDGVAVNDPSAPGGGYDFARLDSDQIARIEILKGPQSTLWGTDAIGGVVNIITKRPQDGLGATLFGEVGSFDTRRGGAAVTGANETGDFRLSASRTDTDGISKADEDNGNTEDDGYEMTTLAARGGLNLPAAARLDVTLLYTDAGTEFDSFVFGAEGNVGDGGETSETEEFSGNVSLSVPLFDGKLENQLVAGFADIERVNFTAGAESFSAKGERSLLRYQGTLTIDAKSTLAFGAEQEETRADGDETSITGLFALYELKPIDSLTLTAGLRNDDHDRFGAETTGRAAVAWTPRETVTMRASWGQGFKAPTLFQTTFLCCGLTEPAMDLAPETSEGVDIGVDLRTPGGRGSASVSVFAQDTENLITFNIGRYENIAEATSRGIELAGEYRLTGWLSLGGTYAYIEAEDGDGNELIRVPPHSATLRAGIDPEGPFSGSVDLRHTGEQMDSTGPVDGWTRVDLNGAYDLSETLELYGRVENLFDADYQQLLGYGTPGLSGSAGIRVRL